MVNRVRGVVEFNILFSMFLEVVCGELEVVFILDLKFLSFFGGFLIVEIYDS